MSAYLPTKPARSMRIGLVVAAALVLQACGTGEPVPAGEDSDPGGIPVTTPTAAGPTLLDVTSVIADTTEADTADTAPASSPPQQDAPPAAENVVPERRVDEVGDPSTEIATSPEPTSPEPTDSEPSGPSSAQPQPSGITPVSSEPAQPIPRLIRESGQVIGNPHYDGMFLIGWDRYVHFQNEGPAGEVAITVEIHGARLSAEMGADAIGNEPPADSLTKSFEIEANEKYVATIEFGVGRSRTSNWVLNTAARVCGFDPVTGLMNANCICTGSNLTIRVRSDPQGLEFQTPDLSATCESSVQLRDITLSVAPESTPTPEPGPGILERAWTFASLETGPNDRDPEPAGIAFDTEGNVYVGVDETHQLLIFDSSGTLETTIGTGERAFGSNDEGDLAGPAGVAVDREGNVYVVETSNNRFQAFTRSGDLLFSQGAYGRDEGEFSAPHGIAFSSEKELYVADSGNHRIQVFDTAGNFLREWGSKGNGDGEFDYPVGVAVSADGLVYVADRNNDRIQVFTSDGAYQTGWPIMVGEQAAERPRAIAIDPRGVVYIAASLDHDEYLVVSDTSGNYLDSWTSFLLIVGGIAISPDSRALYVSDAMFGRIDVFAINHSKIP